MQTDLQVLAQLLTIVALIGATIEYCEVMQRRQRRRRAAASAAEAADAGLRGLVRVFVVD